MRFYPIYGWIKRGPDFAQSWNGWKVYAENETGDMRPVTLLDGHVKKGVDKGGWLDAAAESFWLTEGTGEQEGE